jgi:hypothetical protein
MASGYARATGNAGLDPASPRGSTIGAITSKRRKRGLSGGSSSQVRPGSGEMPGSKPWLTGCMPSRTDVRSASRLGVSPLTQVCEQLVVRRSAERLVGAFTALHARLAADPLGARSRRGLVGSVYPAMLETPTGNTCSHAADRATHVCRQLPCGSPSGIVLGRCRRPSEASASQPAQRLTKSSGPSASSRVNGRSHLGR